MGSAAHRLQLRVDYRSLLALVWPLALARLSEMLLESADGIFLASYGSIELAAVASGDAAYDLSFVAIVGIAEALQIIASRRAGELQPARLVQASVAAAWLVLCVSFAVLVVLRVFSTPLANGLAASVEVTQTAGRFLRTLALGAPLEALNLVFAAVFVSLARPRIVLIATLLLATVNIGLDYLLIFGNLGFPRLGIEGAAMASVFAQLAGTLFYSLAARRVFFGSGLRAALSTPLRPQLRQLIRVGAPIVLEVTIESARWLVFFVVIGWQLGASVLAQANLLYIVYRFVVLFASATGEASRTVTSNVIGQGTATALPQVRQRLLVLGYLLTGALIVVAACGRGTLFEDLTADPALAVGSLRGIVLVSLAALAVVASEVYCGALSGSGDTGAAMLVELLSSLIMLGSALALALVSNQSDIWAAEIAANVIGAMGAVRFLKSSSRHRSGHRLGS